MGTIPTSSSHVSIWDDSVPNQSPKLVIVSIILFAISTLFITTRVASRWAHNQRRLDDAMALLAYLVLLIMTTFLFLAAGHGFGKPMEYITPTLSRALQYFYIFQIFHKLLGCFTKLTFCFLYLRIFSHQLFRKFVVLTAIIITTGSFAFTIATISQCTPLEKAWNRSIDGTCTNKLSFWYSYAAFDTFWGLIIFITPIPMIKTLGLSRSQRYGLISIFCVGALVIATSVVRMVALQSSAETNDTTWGSVDAFMWTDINSNLSVICCCMTALRMPVRKLWNTAIRSSEKSHAASTSRITFDEKPDQSRDVIWAGPHRSSAFVMAGLSLSPADGYYSSNISSTNKNITLQTERRVTDKWYGRALKSFGRDTRHTHSRSSSQENLARPKSSEEVAEITTADGVPMVMELGAIYKTTDLHVSTVEMSESSVRTSEKKSLDMADGLKHG